MGWKSVVKTDAGHSQIKCHLCEKCSTITITSEFRLSSDLIPEWNMQNFSWPVFGRHTLTENPTHTVSIAEQTCMLPTLKHLWLAMHLPTATTFHRPGSNKTAPLHPFEITSARIVSEQFLIQSLGIAKLAQLAIWQSYCQTPITVSKPDNLCRICPCLSL